VVCIQTLERGRGVRSGKLFLWRAGCGSLSFLFFLLSFFVRGTHTPSLAHSAPLRVEDFFGNVCCS
jgi:hypothetical protein